MAVKGKQTDMISGYYSPTGSGACSRNGDPGMGTMSHICTLQTVDSVRRKKPVKPHEPNYFKVHKFFSDGGYDSHAKVCYEPLTKPVTITQNRCCKRPLLMTQPQDLCTLYINVTENAIRDCYAKANSAAVFDLAPQLFELKETLSFIYGVLNAMKKMLLAFAWQTKKLKKALLNPQDLWLQYRYAVMPLVLSISEAIEAYKGGVTKKTYDSRVKIDAVNVYKDPGWVFVGSPNGHYDVRNTCRDTVTATCRLYVRSQCDPNPLGLGLWDMLRGSWEVVKFSFLLDWILGVGDWLDSIRNTNLDISHSYCTTVVDRVATVTSHDSSFMTWIWPVNWGYHEYMMERKVNVVPPILPILQAESLSALRTADSIALLLSFLKGFLTRK